MTTMKYLQSVCAAAGLCAAAAAGAATTDTSVAGHPYVSGGVGNSEQQALRADRGRYSLWAVTAARGSGAYLAEVRVRVTDEQQRTVFDRELDGPWLMIDLPRGRYTVEASHDGQTVRRTASIGAGGPQRMVLYFNVPGADARAG